MTHNSNSKTMKTLKALIAIVLVVVSTNFATAQTEPVDKTGLGNGGYDLVSYFSDAKEFKGNDKYSVQLKGTKYLFTSASHQKAFKANSKKYLPQCDGYCAWGVAEKNTKFPVNPETFKIVDGKLYLFFNGDFNGKPFNTLTEWNKEEKKLITKLPKTWAVLKKS